jgi:serine/threonine-protein kinase
MSGERFGPYELQALIGRGGMGEVWRAHDIARNRTVALKRLHPHLADNREFQIRFRREAQVAARLGQPHVITIHDFGDIDGRLYIDMRLVEGLGLNTILASVGPLPAARAVHITAQAASALAAAHEVGLVHRDVKPSNVLLTDQYPGLRDYVYLVDFGIAHIAEATAMTSTGFTVGTLAYMAPERFDGQGDHRVDIYALGCLLYQALTASRPFSVEGLPALLKAHLRTPPPRPTQYRPDLPAPFDDVVATAMAKAPRDRYSTATEFAAAAQAALTTAGRGPSTPPPLGSAQATRRPVVAADGPARSASRRPPTAATALPTNTGSSSSPQAPRTGAPAQLRPATPSVMSPTPPNASTPRQLKRLIAAVILIAAVLAALLLATVGHHFHRRDLGQASATVPSSAAELDPPTGPAT